MANPLSAVTSNVSPGLSDQFLCHRGPVTCACHVPDSPLVITSAYDGAVGLFDTQTGDVELLGYHAHLVNRVSVNPAGTMAASCSSDFNIHLWDIAARQRVLIMQGHSDDVEDFVFIDEHRGASVSRDGRVLLWNLQTGAILHTFRGHTQDVLSISYHQGRLYTSGDDMTLRIWDIEAGQLVKKIGPFDTETDTCSIDPVHKRIVLGCDDGFIRIFALSTGELIVALNAHDAGIKKVACSLHNGDILSAAYDQRLLVWDADSLEVKKELKHQPGTWERSFNWSADGRFIYAGTFDGTLLQWNALSGDCEKEFGNVEDGSPDTNGNACFNDVATLGKDSIVAVSDDGLIRTGKLSATEAVWQHIHTPETGRVLMNAVTAFSGNSPSGPKQTDVITGTHERAIQRYSVSAGKIVQSLNKDLQQGPINCIRRSDHPDYYNQYFVACYTGAILRVSSEGQILSEIHAHENAVKALVLHPSKPIGISCSADGILSSWEFDGALLNQFPGHLAIIDDVDVSENGEFIASAGRDFTLKIHQLDNAALLHNIDLGKRSPKALAFWGNDIVFVTNYWGDLLRIDLRDQSVKQEKIAENGLSGIAVRGTEIIVSSYDGAIYLVGAEDLRVRNCLRSMTQRINSPAFLC